MSLSKYIKHVYELEKSCYEHKQLLNKLREEYHKAKNPTYLPDNNPEFEYSFLDALIRSVKYIFDSILGYIILACIGGFVVYIGSIWIGGMLFSDVVSWDIIDSIVDGYTVFAIGLYIFLVISNAFSEFHNEKLLAEEGKQNRVRNSLARKKNQKIKDDLPLVLGTIEKAVMTVNESLDDTKELLDNYYDAGIIFPKYRNLVAVSMFHEYLQTGRCSELTGHEGAYNIYEQEARMDLILTKLDDVITRLDRIESNQYILAAAIREINYKVNDLADSVSQCAHSLSNIESDAKFAAHNSAIAAANSRYLTWLYTHVAP